MNQKEEAPLIYGVVVPRCYPAIQFPIGLLNLPPAAAVTGIPMAEILAGVAGLVRFCHRIRVDAPAIWFLPEAGATPALPGGPAAAAQLLPFRLTAEELLFCRWFGHSFSVEAAYPEPEAFAGLSDGHLRTQVVDLLQKLNGDRLVEAAVYQKLNDILNRGWEEPPPTGLPARGAKCVAPSGGR
jgi:hypothetical protein